MSSEAEPKQTRAEKEAKEAADVAAMPIKPPPEPRVKGVHVVLPYLLMGSADIATNKDELKYLGVKHIMNCASEDVDNFFPEDFEYTTYPIEDTHEGEPEAYFEESADVIAKIKDDRSLIFVHCTEGKNIAPTMVLNYMLRSAKKQNKHLPLAQAIGFLSGKAPGISISDQFMLQLAALENELYDEVSVKVKGFSRSGIGGGHHGSRVGVGRGGRGGRGGKGKRGK